MTPVSSAVMFNRKYNSCVSSALPPSEASRVMRRVTLSASMSVIVREKMVALSFSCTPDRD